MPQMARPLEMVLTFSPGIGLRMRLRLRSVTMDSHHIDLCVLHDCLGFFAHMQMLFRSVNKLLMDTATTEYLFCCEFFQEDGVFAELFAATLAVVEGALSAQLQVGPVLYTLCIIMFEP